MFTKEERLFIWKNVYEEIERSENGDYICVMLRNIVFKFFRTSKKIESIYGLYLDKLVKIYFPELEEKKSMATEPEEEWRIYGWFGCISPETKEVRLNIVKDIIKEGDYIQLYTIYINPASVLYRWCKVVYNHQMIL